jgi:hypothetical protein
MKIVMEDKELGALRYYAFKLLKKTVVAWKEE